MTKTESFAVPIFSPCTSTLKILDERVSTHSADKNVNLIDPWVTESPTLIDMGSFLLLTFSLPIHPVNNNNKIIIGTILSLLIVIVIFTLFLQPDCDGEQKWYHKTGKLQFISVRTELCCHCHTVIKFYNQSPIYTVDCNEDLADIPINKTYTFYFKPFPEPYATTGNSKSCFWDNVVDYVENENGDKIKF